MFNKKYFSSVIFFLFIALFISLFLGTQDESRAASKPASYESYCPYQEQLKDLTEKAMTDAPKLTDKGDFYFSKKGKVHLLRSKNQVAITGESSRIEQMIKGVKKGKGHEKKSLGKQKHTYLYTFFLQLKLLGLKKRLYHKLSIEQFSCLKPHLMVCMNLGFLNEYRKIINT